jgi:hypothetical protein
MSQTLLWSDDVDRVFAGDHVVALGYLTPLRGVVLTPVTNFGVRDRERATLTFNSSVGAWGKLRRLSREPAVAIAFHTRRYSRTDRPEYVLAQGRVELGPLDEPSAWRAELGGHWDRFVGHAPEDESPLWRWWLRDYHWRVNLQVHLERLLVWSDLECRGSAQVLGRPLPELPRSHRVPKLGTAPRVDAVAAAGRLRTLPEHLLGFAGADGLPMLVPVRIGKVSAHGIGLNAAPGLVPPGGRRAGLLGHWFSERVLGQRQRKHTGWLAAEEDGRLLFSPHTESGYCLPASKLAYKAGAGWVTRRGVRQARRSGYLRASNGRPAWGIAGL